MLCDDIATVPLAVGAVGAMENVEPAVDAVIAAGVLVVVVMKGDEKAVIEGERNATVVQRAAKDAHHEHHPVDRQVRLARHHEQGGVGQQHVRQQELHWMCVDRSNARRSPVLMMNTVNVFVKKRGMKEAVRVEEHCL